MSISDLPASEVFAEGHAGSSVMQSQAQSELMLCIASGQSLPNVLPLRVRPWERLVIYTSAGMRAEAQRLEAVAGLIGATKRVAAVDCCELVNLPEDLSYRTLAAFAFAEVERLANAFPQLRLAFNATGGQKTMALAFAKAMQGRGDVFYTQTDRDCIEQIEPLGPDQALPAALLDLDTYLAVQGYFITRRVPLEDAVALERVRRRARLTATLVRRVGELRHNFSSVPPGFPKAAPRNILGALHAAAVAFCEAGKAARAQPSSSRQRVAVPGESPWWAALFDEAVACGVLQDWTRDGSCFELTFSSTSAALYLGGGYLEEYVHLAVHALGLPAGAAARGVGVDLLVRREGRKTGELNELDIAITWRNRLLILECKAGRQLFEPGKSQEILNKLALLRSQLGGNFGQAWILCTGKVDEQHHADILERATAAHLKVLDGRQLANLPQLLARALELQRPADLAADWIDAPLSVKLPAPEKPVV